MRSALDAAKYILHSANTQNIAITPLKLLELRYITNGWYASFF